METDTHVGVSVQADYSRIDGSRFEYVGELRLEIKGSSWTTLVGLNYNF